MVNIDSREPRSNLELDGLIDRAAAGDTEAFGHLYDIFADRIYRYICYKTGNHDDAWDLTQNVFLETWKALPRYRRTEAPFLGWLFTICRHTVIDYYRTKKKNVSIDDGLLIEDPEKGPEKLVEEKFTQQEIRQAILELPGNYQQVMMFCFIEGFGYSEVAQIMNKSEGNIRVIVHRSLKKMRQILGEAGSSIGKD